MQLRCVQLSPGDACSPWLPCAQRFVQWRGYIAKPIYKVVVNHEEQYSIWPAEHENALGWTDAGKIATREDCLTYIKEVWTDMRPLSLRKQMEAAGEQHSMGRPTSR